MRLRFLFAIIAALYIPIDLWGAHYKLGTGTVALSTCDTSVVVQFTKAPDSTAIAQFLSDHQYLSLPPDGHFNQYYVRFRMDSGVPYDTAVAEIASDTAIVLPVYSSQGGSLLWTTNRVTVNFADGLSRELMDSVAATYNVSIMKIDQYDPSYTVCEIDSGSGLLALNVGNAMHDDPQVDWACASFHAQFRFSTSPPNDNLYHEQWYLNRIQWDSLQNKQVASRFPITVAVLDVGLATHEDLASSQVLEGFDYLGDSTPPMVFPDDDATPPNDLGKPILAHGTSCAGIIAAKTNNVLGVSGLSRSAMILPIKIAWNNGLMPTDAEILHDAILGAAQRGAMILSNSWGYGSSDIIPQIKSAIDSVVHPIASRPYGCVFIASAGNEVSSFLAFPGVLNEVISVGWTNGSNIFQGNFAGIDDPPGCDSGVVCDDTLDVVAPGTDIWTLDLMGNYGWNPDSPSDPSPDPNYTGEFGGSSASCPMVAGVIATVLSRRPDLISDTTQWTARDILRNTAKDQVGDSFDTPGYDNFYGFGLLNAYDAVLAVSRGDANGDAIYDIADVVEVRRRLVQPWLNILIHKGLSDLNCDGALDTTDFRLATDVVFRDAELPNPCFEFDY